MKHFTTFLPVMAVLLASAGGCSTQHKLEMVRAAGMAADIGLAPDGPSSGPAPGSSAADAPEVRRCIDDDAPDGTGMFVLNAERDEDSGQMVAVDRLNAAVVTARFRHVAERRGSVRMAFRITVADSLIDDSWQLRFQPVMRIMGDTVSLEPVYVTGSAYRRRQLRGYEQYERFLQSLSRDSTRFVDSYQLEMFLRRNIPAIYAFRADSSFVSDEQFRSAFGVSGEEALDHYTIGWRKRLNARRAGMKQAVHDRYIKSPIVSDGIRLDTVMRSGSGGLVYEYVQTVATRPGLRKVEMMLSGGIYDDADTRLYTMPETGPLTFYVSSLSSFADESVKYRTEVISRRVSADAGFNIAFATGRYEFDPLLADNAVEEARIKARLASLLDDEVFDVDSILVTASCSPEGSYAVNGRLAGQRSGELTGRFHRFMRAYADSLSSAGGFAVDASGSIVRGETPQIAFKSRSVPEDWDGLDALVEEDDSLDAVSKAAYRALRSIPDADAREAAMREAPYYLYVHDVLYPRLRSVRFDFRLHRRGMVKDTIRTSVPDTLYMSGVQALKDRDYERAVAVLGPYADFNAAVAYISMDCDASAMRILSGLEETPAVCYLLAILHVRAGDDGTAARYYRRACTMDGSYVHRGNLDPEISKLVRRLGIDPEAPDKG